MLAPRIRARASSELVSPLTWLLVGAMLWAESGGCVTRRMTIRTNPPGARVFVDDYEIGTTPVSHGFTYYGKRKIRLVKDGYETMTVLQSIPAPWYEIAPLDFVSENVVPMEIRDQRTLDFQLTPQVVVPTEVILGRAEELRRSVQTTGGAVPLPYNPAVPGGSAVPGSFVPPEPVPRGVPLGPVPGSAEPIATPPAIGGQPVYALPPKQ